MTTHAGVSDQEVDRLVWELFLDGEVYVPTHDGITYRLVVTQTDAAVTVSWFDGKHEDVATLRPAVWASGDPLPYESDRDWRERVARGFIFAVLDGIDLREERE